MFCSGVTKMEKFDLMDCLQMKEGSLPVRYFSVPLISKKLSAEDCGVLTEQDVE
jgi:hypothetical protein